MTHLWLDTVLGPWWRTAIDGFMSGFWMIVIPIVIWMWAMRTGGQTQSLVLREANTFIVSLGQRADRLSDEELLQRFRPTLHQIGEQQQWMPAMSGLWIQRANGATIEHAVRLTPTTMHRIREDIRHKHQRRTRAGGSRSVL